MQSANLQLLLLRLQGNSNGGLLHPLSTAGKVSRLEPLRPTSRRDQAAVLTSSHLSMAEKAANSGGGSSSHRTPAPCRPLQLLSPLLVCTSYSLLPFLMPTISPSTLHQQLARAGPRQEQRLHLRAPEGAPEGAPGAALHGVGWAAVKGPFCRTKAACCSTGLREIALLTHHALPSRMATLQP